MPTSENAVHPNFVECPKGEVRRILIPRTRVNSVGGRRDLSPAPSGFIAPFCARGYYVSYLVELGEWPCRGFGSGWCLRRVPVSLRLWVALEL
jgi:hypothetical protein